MTQRPNMKRIHRPIQGYSINQCVSMRDKEQLRVRCCLEVRHCNVQKAKIIATRPCSQCSALDKDFGGWTSQQASTCWWTWQKRSPIVFCNIISQIIFKWVSLRNFGGLSILDMAFRWTRAPAFIAGVVNCPGTPLLAGVGCAGEGGKRKKTKGTCHEDFPSKTKHTRTLS